MSLSAEQHAAALANLYPEAVSAIEGWPLGRLEARAVQPHSSQALCVSLFETIGLRAAAKRDAIFGDLLERAGLRLGVVRGTTIETEVRDHRDVLSEIGGGTPTALDGLLRWKSGVTTIESKFTEREFGGCSQFKPSKVTASDPRFVLDDPSKRFANCTGRHETGSDLKPATQRLKAACRLTLRDRNRLPRLYWDLAPELFEPDVYALARPCPFRADTYQLMRNMSFAYKWAQENRLADFAFLVVLVDSAPAATKMRSTVEEFRGLLLQECRARLGVISYEEVAELLEQPYGENALAQWIRRRIAEVCDRASPT